MLIVQDRMLLVQETEYSTQSSLYYEDIYFPHVTKIQRYMCSVLVQHISDEQPSLFPPLAANLRVSTLRLSRGKLVAAALNSIL